MDLVSYLIVIMLLMSIIFANEYYKEGSCWNIQLRTCLYVKEV